MNQSINLESNSVVYRIHPIYHILNVYNSSLYLRKSEMKIESLGFLLNII